MAADDKVAILTDDEEEQKRKYVLSDPPVSSPPAAPAPGPAAGGGGVGCCGRLLLRVSGRLLVSKLWYLFFYAAYGSLQPLLAVFYRQLGLSAARSGLLVGLRYFMEFCSAPFWGLVADRFQKGKVVLLLSVASWLLFNGAIGFVPAAQLSCVAPPGAPTPLSPAPTPPGPAPTPPGAVTPPPANASRSRRGLADQLELPGSSGAPLRAGLNVTQAPPTSTQTTPTTTQSPPTTTQATTSTTQTPPTSTQAPPTTTQTPPTTQAPPNSTQATPTTPQAPPPRLEYDGAQVETIFLLLLLVVVVGEFFSAPAVTIVDTATLQLLGRARDRYGLQRMWGSLGWGVAMLLVGVWIDHTHLPVVVHGAGCPPPDWHNYRMAFVVFAVLMAAAFVVSTQFRLGEPPVATATDAEPGGVQDGVQDGAQDGGQAFGYGELLRLLCTVRYGSVLAVACFMGFGYGFVFSFLFWHLEDLKGTTTLFGVCSALSHVSELAAYFSSHKLIELVGHVRVLYIGLACNTARYLYISYLQNAWTVLPMEVLQGVTHASVWAACISLLSAAVPPALRTSAQGILQGLHLGLGRGCGAMVGGVLVHYFGAAAAFRGVGMASLLILLAFAFIQWLSGEPDGKEDQILAENVPVPSSPVPIATIDLVQAGPPPPGPPPPRKTRHQEAQEDPGRPAWAPGAAPGVSLAFALLQVRELMAKRSSAPPPPPTEGQPLQVTSEQATASEDQQPSDSAPPDPTGPPRPDPTRPAPPDCNGDQAHP